MNILYSDEDHLVFLKQAGIPTHGRSKSSLVHQVQRDAPIYPVHRLDYGTRGPVIFAKNLETLHILQQMWPMVGKTYHAWVAGSGLPDKGLCGMSLEGKPSRTDFQNLGQRSWAVHGHATLLEWNLRSGRTHQIRRHASAMGHPIIGDAVYGAPPLFTGQGLHLMCTHLAWKHPFTGEDLSVTVSPSKKMRRAVAGAFQVAEESPFLRLFQG